jgi:hypothetical protein
MDHRRRGGDGRMPKQVEQYRLNAEKCQQLAQTFEEPEAKRALFAMADSWLTLAAQRLKNIEKARKNLRGDPKQKVAELLSDAVLHAGRCLDQNARLAGTETSTKEWQSLAGAPFDRDLEVAVINYDGTHALAFPCRRVRGGWVNAKTMKPVLVYPTHWRQWQDLKHTY